MQWLPSLAVFATIPDVATSGPIGDVSADRFLAISEKKRVWVPLGPAAF